jgi:hypothetical protein
MLTAQHQIVEDSLVRDSCGALIMIHRLYPEVVDLDPTGGNIFRLRVAKKLLRESMSK